MSENACPTGPTCPGVFDLNENEFLIVGRFAGSFSIMQVGAIVGNGEVAIVISKKLVEEKIK